MDYNKYKLILAGRIVLIALTLLLFYDLAYNDAYSLTVLLVLVLAIVQIVTLIKQLEKNHTDIEEFFTSLKNGDFDYRSEDATENQYKKYLYHNFNEVLKKVKSKQSTRDERQQYLTTIVQHVGIGLLTFDEEGNIQIMNIAAKKILRLEHVKNISQLEKISFDLVDAFKRLKTGGRALIKLEVNNEEKQLSVYAIELQLGGKKYKLISIQNIQSELEENEMEAWQKLVRVLTHEIMNSVTPISSLANTVDEELMLHLKEKGDSKLTKDELEDLHLAISTIQRRSEGLINFVSDFRSLSLTPEPKIQDSSMQELFDHLDVLFKNEARKNNIQLIFSVTPNNMEVSMDPEQIQQVLINLIKNAMQALNGHPDKKIELSAYHNDKGHTVIIVKDNGPGIDEEALQKIFIPFFTTKKTGSGIGLSLSRQIMRNHHGSISVRSKLNEGSEFTLRF